MAAFDPRRGRREAADNLGHKEDGDCARCGGEAQPSTMSGYLSCARCGYEWKDPDHVEARAGPLRDDHHHNAQLVEQFKQEMKSGELRGMLGIDKGLSGEQEASLQRLEDKWMSGMQGQFNAAVEERKPLMINFDDDDNIVSTTVAAFHILTNDFDGGEELRLEYPSYGTEFYAYNETSPTGWRRGRTREDTARSITNAINRHSRLVYANLEGHVIHLELREANLDPAALVVFVDDPGGQDIVAEKGGVLLDHREVQVIADYQAVVRLVLEDGVISPSEDQLLWAMRQELGIDDHHHVKIVLDAFGDQAQKECTGCGGMADLYPEHAAWYCHACEAWC